MPGHYNFCNTGAVSKSQRHMPAQFLTLLPSSAHQHLDHVSAPLAPERQPPARPDDGQHPVFKVADEQAISMLAGTPIEDSTEYTRQHKPRVQFEKLGENADHPLTRRMREIKDSLRLTTLQISNQVNEYEREFHRNDLQDTIDEDGNSPYLPMKPVPLSLYLQGWVLQESYLVAICKRLERFYAYKKSQPNCLTADIQIRTLMDEWFQALHIDPKSKTVSPYRLLAKKLAPFYKRPVRIQVAGVFKLGATQGGLQSFSVLDDQGVEHEYFLNPTFTVLIKNGQRVNIRDVVQYAVLTQGSSSEPIIDHTAFFRWYKSNKMPKSIKTVELVQEAVEDCRGT